MDCPICYCEMTTTNSMVTDCKHRFHRTCLEKWAFIQEENRLNCPMCRANIDPFSVMYVYFDLFDATETLFGTTDEPFYLPFSLPQDSLPQDNRTSLNLMDRVSSE